MPPKARPPKPHEAPHPGDDPARLEKSRKARASRNKGKRGERKILALLAELWPEARRNIQDRGGQRDGPDLEFDVPLLDVEVKHRQISSLRQAIRDAIINRRQGRRWMAIDAPTKRGLPTTVTMELAEFCELVQLERARAAAQSRPAVPPRPKLPLMPPGYTMKLNVTARGEWIWYPPNADERGADVPPIDQRMCPKMEASERAWAHWRASASPEWRAFFGQFDTAQIEE
jgi:hypothetical protein